MAPAASIAKATEINAAVEALRAGAASRPARILRRPGLFNDYAPGSARLFHAWRP